MSSSTFSERLVRLKANSSAKPSPPTSPQEDPAMERPTTPPSGESIPRPTQEEPQHQEQERGHTLPPPSLVMGDASPETVEVPVEADSGQDGSPKPRGPFWDWVSLIAYLKGRIASRYDNVIVISGKEGRGKSNLAMWLAVNLTPDFKSDSDVVFNHEEWRKVIPRYRSRPGLVLLLDEGGNLALAHDWSKRENRNLRKILMQARVMRATIILAIPKFKNLDPYIRDHRCVVRLHMTGRGFFRAEYMDTDDNTEDTRPVPVFRNYRRVPNLRVTHPELWSTYEKRKESTTFETMGELAGVGVTGGWRTRSPKKLALLSLIKAMESKLQSLGIDPGSLAGTTTDGTSTTGSSGVSTSSKPPASVRRRKKLSVVVEAPSRLIPSQEGAGQRQTPP